MIALLHPPAKDDPHPRLSCAFQLAEAGMHVFPLNWIANGRCTCGKRDCGKSSGKHAFAKLAPHGLKDATADLDQVWAWWSDYPSANIGLPTGSINGIIVLDEDGPEGAASVAALEAANAPLPPTLTSQTGRDGGRHRLFAYAGTEIKNSAGKLGVGLDVRGEGGCIVAPPSGHLSGRCYRWVFPLVAPAPLPAWLRNLMTSPSAPPPAPRASFTAGGDSRADLLRRARKYVASCEGVGEGSRDTTVFRLAGHLAALVNTTGEMLAGDEIADVLFDFARRCVPPFPENEMREKVKSALQNGTPREPKPSMSSAQRRIQAGLALRPAGVI